MNNRKKLVLVCLFMAIIPFAKAQENSDFKTDTVTFLKLTGGAQAFEQAVTQIGAIVSAVNKEAFHKEAAETVDVLYNKMAAMYMEEFTHDEVKELITFYNSDLGKKMASKQLALTQKAMLLGQNWGMELQVIAQKYK